MGQELEQLILSPMGDFWGLQRVCMYVCMYQPQRKLGETRTRSENSVHCKVRTGGTRTHPGQLRRARLLHGSPAQLWLVDLAEMLQIVRANGWDRNLTTVQQKKWRDKFDIRDEFQAKYTFYDLGFNLRPTEITGFLGLNQLKYLDSTIKKREENYIHLEAVIKNNDELFTLDRTHLSLLSSFAIPVISRQ